MLYVYAISDSRPRPAGRGLLGEPLRVIASGRLNVIAGEVEAAPPALPQTIRAHDAVVRRLAGRCPALLPARFGWTCTERDLRAQLAPHRRELLRALADVRGCVQMTLRVFGDTPSDRPRGARRRPRTGTAYMLERAEARRTSESLPELDPLRSRLADLLRGERQERHGTAGLVGTAYHLVERARLRAYRARLRGAAAVLDPFRLHVSGPWAPYAFGPRSLS